jgi:hypothetical protein
MIETRQQYDSLLQTLRNTLDSKTSLVGPDNKSVEVVQLDDQLLMAHIIDRGAGPEKWWKPIDREALPPAATPALAGPGAGGVFVMTSSLARRSGQLPDPQTSASIAPQSVQWPLSVFDAPQSLERIWHRDTDASPEQLNRPIVADSARIAAQNREAVDKIVAHSTQTEKFTVFRPELVEELVAAGRAPEDIARFASHKIRHDALSVFLTYAPVLLSANYDEAGIVKLANLLRADLAFPAVVQYGPQLEAAGFSRADILKVASHDGAALALPTLVDCATKLQAAGFNRGDIIRVANNAGAAPAMRALLELGPTLVNLGVKQEEIIKISRHNGSAQALRAIVKHAPQLVAVGFSIADVSKVANNKGGSQALSALVACHAKIASAGFSSKQIVSMAATRSGAVKLKMVETYQEQLRRQGVSLDAIAQKVSRAMLTPTKFLCWIESQSR